MKPDPDGLQTMIRTEVRRRALLLWGGLCICVALPLVGQQPKVAYSDQEKLLVAQLRGLRQLPDEERAKATKELALEIRALPASPNKTFLARGWLTCRPKAILATTHCRSNHHSGASTARAT